VARDRAAVIVNEACERVAQERKRLVAEAVGDGDRYPGMRSLGALAFVCYPLLAQGRLMGTLIFARAAGRRSRSTSWR